MTTQLDKLISAMQRAEAQGATDEDHHQRQLLRDLGMTIMTQLTEASEAGLAHYPMMRCLIAILGCCIRESNLGDAARLAALISLSNELFSIALDPTPPEAA